MSDFPKAGSAVPSGSGMVWFSNTPPTGWAILDGSTITNAQTLYPELWANVDAAWKSGSNIILPDLRGRMPVGKGTHVDVDTLNKSDGVAVANRRPVHKHTAGIGSLATVNDTPDHGHGYTMDNSTLRPYLDTSGGPYSRGGGVASAGNATGGASARHTHPITGAPTVGPQTGAEPTDSTAFIVVNFIIKL
jgi:microcystin-dependent protein